MARHKATPTYVTLLLDRSGSMGGIKSQTIEGFNSYVGTLQAEKKADIRFTFLQFDDVSLDKVYVAEPVANVKFLNDATYQPRGNTPLIDAAYKTILAVEEATAREEVKPKIVVCIQTDGEENRSSEYTWEALSALVKQKQDAGWQFNFIGAGINAYNQAQRMNIGRAATMSYGMGRAETVSAFAATANNASMFASGVAHNTSYLQSQKRAAADAFDIDLLKDKK